MEPTQKKPRKVVTTLAITKEAQDIIFDNGYASARTQGEFISQLIVDYYARKTHEHSTAELTTELHRASEELHRLVDLLAKSVP